MIKRVGIAAFLHESNTYSPLTTTRAQFEQASLTKKEDVLLRWRGSNHEIGGFIDGASDFGFDAVPLMATYAVPGGTITSETFDALAEEMIEALRAALPLDGVLMALHGATVAENHPDADGELAYRFRQILGPAIPIIVTLDLHANVSAKMIENTNATVIYQSNPHLDQKQRGIEAAKLMSLTLSKEITPVQAFEKPPFLINISKQYTEVPPASDLYEEVKAVLRWPGIVSASVAMGFYYSDVEEMGPAFVAVADNDPDLAKKAAQWMALKAWGNRSQFIGNLPSPSEGVQMAILAGKTPVILMDVGDNIGGGSPGDSTILFEEILCQGVNSSLVVLYDPQSVSACVARGVRKEIELMVGGKTDDKHGRPLKVKGRIRTISDGLFFEDQIRHGGWGRNDQGVTAVVEMEDENTVVLTSHRMAPMSLEQILSLGIKPEKKKMIIVKGVVAPRAAYEPIAGEIIVVDTPGSTSANPGNFQYHHRRRPLYPLEADAEYLLF